jgi:raffinose/stachyose/melibiose transport system permease protein
MKFRLKSSDLIRATILTLMVFVVILPLTITIFASMKTPLELGNTTPLTPPAHLMLANYLTVFQVGGVFRSFFNSMYLVVVSLIINTFLASTVSYCLSRFDFKLKKLVLLLFLMGMIVPVYVTEISRFGIIKMLGLYNTHWAAITIYAGADMMQVYVYMQFMSQIPKSLDESAMLDGLPLYKIYWRIILPLLLPAVATLGILKMVDIMNDMYIPFLYMPSMKLRTLTTNLMAAFSDSRLGAWQNLSAAIIIVMLPVTIIYLIFQKQVMRGIMAGAVKG